MLSKKCQKYMCQYQEKNYAPKVRKLEKSDLKKHSHGSESRQTAETSNSDCVQQSREVQEEIIYIGIGNEIIRKENASEAYQEGRQRVQESDKRRCETQEENLRKTKGEIMKKPSVKEKKHEAKESKAHEKKEDKKESKSKKK